MIAIAYLCTAISVCDLTPTKVFVIDGDTVSINQERIRIEGIDAPEMKGKCRNESHLARQAQALLANLINGSELVIARTEVRQGTGYKIDRYGRTLAPLIANGHDVGAVILQRGLARKWTKKWDRRAEPWCASSIELNLPTD